jgi:hypothetical protein
MVCSLDEIHRLKKFFKPLSIPVRDFLMAKMQRSRRLGSMYLGAKVFETLVRNPEEVGIRLCSPWVLQYKNHVTNPDRLANRYPSIQETEDKLGGLLEVSQTGALLLTEIVIYSDVSYFS